MSPITKSFTFTQNRCGRQQKIYKFGYKIKTVFTKLANEHLHNASRMFEEMFQTLPTMRNSVWFLKRSKIEIQSHSK